MKHFRQIFDFQLLVVTELVDRIMENLRIVDDVRFWHADLIPIKHLFDFGDGGTFLLLLFIFFQVGRLDLRVQLCLLFKRVIFDARRITLHVEILKTRLRGGL